MSTFSKPMGYLAAVAAAVGVAGCGSETNSQGADMIATANDERPVPLPQPPIKIPMPLDRAGAKVDITFEVPPLSKGQQFFSSYFVGLRIPFSPPDSEVVQIVQDHPISARIFLYRIEDGEEIPVPLFSRTKRPPPGKPPLRGSESFELPGGEAIAAIHAARHTNAPHGTPNASTLVLSFASGRVDGIPGMYRLQVETLEDIPELSGITSFLVYEAYRLN